jgi:uncharacterized protein (TIGR03435 family)
MASLIEIISQDTRRVVVDSTGFTEKFDFRLEFTPSEATTWHVAAPLAPSEPGAGVPIGTALQQQLGLRLQPAKRQVEVLVIDHVERPSEN